MIEQVTVGSLLIIFGLALALWVADQISSPLRELEADAALLESGELAHRTSITGSGEIGLLAATMNRMAQALQQRTLMLEQRTESLEASEARLRRLAHYDVLTGLANRSLFMERLDARIEEAERARSGFTVLFVDVDHFKLVNDTHGHRAGDEVLISFARTLERLAEHGETMARLSGDEFMVILSSVADLDRASERAQSIVDAVRSSIGSGKREVQVSASVGVALFEFGETGASLLNRADEALYMAKRMGRSHARTAFRSANR